jgi:hypothetical protein
MFSIEAFDVLKIKEFTILIDCFQNKPACHVGQAGENRGHYGQALIRSGQLRQHRHQTKGFHHLIPVEVPMYR